MAAQEAAREAARTAPRENGGNQDIKNLSRGEITFCGAIEMDGYLDLRVEVIKGGVQTYGITGGAAIMDNVFDDPDEEAEN